VIDEIQVHASAPENGKTDKTCEGCARTGRREEKAYPFLREPLCGRMPHAGPSWNP